MNTLSCCRPASVQSSTKCAENRSSLGTERHRFVSKISTLSGAGSTSALNRLHKLQDHLNEFLAMSGILLQKESDDYSGSLLGCFHKAELRAMHENVMSNLGMMPRYAAGFLCLTKTRIKLLQLSLKGTREEGRILQAVEAIVNSAKECEMLPFSEHGLSASYLHPFLHALLSDVMPYTIPHCLNLLLPNSVATATNRPDYVVDVYKQNKHAYTNGVGEMKLATVRQGDAVLDLYRTAIFAKECLDKYNLEMVIGFQAVETTITFYGLNLFMKSSIRTRS
ncbi:hypothetical protein G6F62_009780 [Rhizopus arrhizus]|nr:hypothetical protein G6F62_009780 [Rhizopus arrhizus]